MSAETNTELMRDLQKRLVRTKATCDEELNTMIEYLASDLENLTDDTMESEFFAALEQLHGLALQLLQTDMRNLNGNMCRKLVSAAQALQTEWKDAWQCRHYVTTMLLAFSRVSRVVDQMENINGSGTATGGHATHTAGPDSLVKVASVEIFDSRPSRLTADHGDISESRLPTPLGNVDDRRSPSGTSAIEVSELDLTLCRICEGHVSRDVLRNHSRYCAVVQRNVVEIESCDELLLTLLSTMERRAYNLAHGAQKGSTNPDEIASLESLIAVIKAALDLESARDVRGERSRLAGLVDAFSANAELSALARRLANVIGRKAAAVQAKQQTIAEAGSLLPRESYTADRSMPCIKDFSFLKTISRGSFGHVYLTRKRITGDYYAIKVLKKKDLVRKNQVESIKNERNILTMLNSPFVTKLYYCFQSVDYLYIVMEYANGGDLFSLLRSVGALDESWARFYIAEVVVALEHIHAMGIVHRDIKPDNLLINKDGHIKLADFGLSRTGLGECHWVSVLEKATGNLRAADDSATPTRKSSLGRRRGSIVGTGDKPTNRVAPMPSATANRSGSVLLSLESRRSIYQERCRRSALYSCVGTSDYLAPEVILGIGHDTAVDWWATGVCLYEFLSGAPPFFQPDLQDTFANILERNIEWPDEVSPLARDLINRLLTVDVDRRLGSRGAAEVKTHPFFIGLDWQNLAFSQAAYVPVVSDFEDTSRFAPGLRAETATTLNPDTRNQSIGGSSIRTADGEGASVSIPRSASAARGSGGRSSSDETNAIGGSGEPDPQAAIAGDPFGDFRFKNCNLLDDVNQRIGATPLLPDASIAGMRRDSRSSESIGREIDRHLDCLVAEDNPVTQRIVDALLKQIGISVTQALDGSAAVKAASLRKYDMIFMDIMMPGMDGEQATELIRRGGPNRKTPIIAFTAMGETNTTTFLEKGFSDVLAKPFTKTELYKIVQKWLKVAKDAS